MLGHSGQTNGDDGEFSEVQQDLAILQHTHGNAGLDHNTNTAEESAQSSEHAQYMDLVEPLPPSPGASPSGCNVEDKESEQILQSPHRSSALDLQYSARYGIESTRVELHLNLDHQS